MYIALERPGAGQWMHFIARNWEFGRIGVAVFFAISGFVIVPSLRGPRWPALKRFAILRTFRLYPAYWFSILPGAYIFWWMWGKPFGMQDLALNFTMVPEILGAKAALGVYWTLQAELAFYLLCALLFCLGWLRRPMALMGVSLLCILAGALYKTHTGSSEDWLGIHLSIMLFGGAVRLWMEARPRNRWLGAAFVAYLLAWCGAALLARHLPAERMPDMTKVYLHAYVVALGIFVAGVTAGRMRSRLLGWVGRVSYSVYLLHPVALYTVLWNVSHNLPALGHFHIAAYSTVVLAMTLLMAWLCYQLVEQPCLAFGKQLAARLPPLERRDGDAGFEN